MGYPKEILQEALEIVRERGRAAKNQAEERRRRLESELPEFREIETAITGAGLKAASAVFAGAENTGEILKSLMEENLENQKRLRELLTGRNLPPDYLAPAYRCGECSDTGYRNKKLCTCVQELAKKISFERLNAASPLSLCGFEEFKLSFYSDEKDEQRGFSPRDRMGKILQSAKAYARDFTPDSENLLFIGASGLGKTHLSLAIAREVLAKGYGVVYGSAQDLLHKIEQEHFGRADEDTLALLLGCDLLIFDDFGTEFSSPFIQSTVYNIINSRMLERRPTIISTNLTLSEIRKDYHERIVSRLVGGYVIQEFIGKDVRYLKKCKR